MITWEYLAGFFDGEGCYSIALQKKKNGYRQIQFQTFITADIPTLKIIRKFLESEGIKCYKLIPKNQCNPISKSKNTAHLSFTNKESIHLFCKKIYPIVISKKKQTKIILNALSSIKNLENIRLSDPKKFFSVFDNYRHYLHKYAKKGPKLLKTWDI